MARRIQYSSFFHLIVIEAIAILSVVNAQEQEPRGEVIGGRNIIIPAPSGYVRSDDINDQWNQITGDYTPPGNRKIATFTLNSDQQILANNGLPQLQRHFYVQVIKAFENTDFPDEQFKKTKERLKKEILEHQKSTGDILEEELTAGSESITGRTGIEIAFTLTDPAFLGFFDESNLALGFSIESTVTVDGQSQPMVSSARIAPVAERMLVFYAVSLKRGEADKEWTENAVIAWSDMVMAANPSVFEEPHPMPTLSPQRIAAIAVLVIGLVAWLIFAKIRRKRQTQSKSHPSSP
ncbi:MAG: hypothetical protein KDN22_03425 [Verrucomicrobiae bacterium]|nr:hypothetical protein [Verrucomicrobiae bacterium]